MKDYDPHSVDEQQAALAKTVKIKRDQDLEDLRFVLADKRGRRTLLRLLEKTGVYRNPFTGNSETYFKCGEMNIGQWLIAEVQAVDSNSYAELLKENVNNGN
jgi:hypothetical protein